MTLDDLQWMCDAPSDAWSAAEWCEAANELLAYALAYKLDNERAYIAYRELTEGRPC